MSIGSVPEIQCNHDKINSLTQSSYNPNKKNPNSFKTRLTSRLQFYTSEVNTLRKVCTKHGNVYFEKFRE